MNNPPSLVHALVAFEKGTSMDKNVRIAIIGGGPAGLSAALNVRARGHSVLVVSNPLEENPLWRAEKVDNYLGLPAMTGPEMLTAMRRHAESAGAEFRTGKVLNAMHMSGVWYVSIGNDMENAKAVVLAAGVARGKKFPGEAEFLGRGVSYCATCDGMFYRGKRIAVLSASLQGVIILHDQMSPYKLAGCLMILLSLLVPVLLNSLHRPLTRRPAFNH